MAKLAAAVFVLALLRHLSVLLPGGEGVVRKAEARATAREVAAQSLRRAGGHEVDTFGDGGTRLEGAAVGPGRTFLCDGSRVLPLSALDDDFCDCVDGSDERRTSACSALQGEGAFTCATGDRLRSVYLSMLRDGVCDCKPSCSDER